MRMKFVLCLVALMMCIIPVSATDDSFHWVNDITTSDYATGQGSALATHTDINYLYIPDAELYSNWKSTHYVLPAGTAHLVGGDALSGWDTSVVFSIGGVQVGTGIFGYNVAPDGKIYVSAIAWDFSLEGYAGVQTVDITSSTIKITDAGDFQPTWNDGSGLVLVQYGSNKGPLSLGRTGTNISVNLYLDYYNNYSYESYSTHNFLTINRSANNVFKGLLNINGSEVKNDTAYDTYDFEYLSYDISNYTWDLSLTNLWGFEKTKTLQFTPALITSTGTISLNQSSYTEPELVQIDAELTTYDFTGHSYHLIVEARDNSSGSSWDNIAGILNQTTTMSTTTQSWLMDIDTWPYSLPMWIRAKLMDYNKNTGVYTTIYTSSMALYNPPLPGSIKFAGVVVDAYTNSPISGATVSVSGMSVASDTTNAYGEFLLYIQPGTYTVTGSKSGYESNVNEDLNLFVDTVNARIPLVEITTANGTLYGIIKDKDTNAPLQSVHVVISNDTDTISAYSASNGYYEADGLAQASTYTIRALKSGYYNYNGSVTTEATGPTAKSFNMLQVNATVVPTDTVTYPGGSGTAWSNDDIVNWLRVNVMNVFILIFFLVLAAFMMSFGGNSGGNQRDKYGPGIWSFNKRKRW